MLANMDSESLAVTVEDVENVVNSLDLVILLIINICILHMFYYLHLAIFACLTVLFNEILLYGVVPENFGLNAIHYAIKSDR